MEFELTSTPERIQAIKEEFGKDATINGNTVTVINDDSEPVNMIRMFGAGIKFGLQEGIDLHKNKI